MLKFKQAFTDLKQKLKNFFYDFYKYSQEEKEEARKKEEVKQLMVRFYDEQVSRDIFK